MKIIFLCGSLEQGRDGVGDYTRRLGIEMKKQGHEVAAIALKDWHIADEFEGIQNSEDVDLPVLRLPAALPSKLRFKRAKEWTDAFDPAWISLQFVSFAFHFKGLHVGLSKKLAVLGKGRRWQIMFHELWVGMAVEASKKHVFWGAVQRFMIKNLISNIKPAIINTQSQLYLVQLTKLGYKAEYLPLFSNIPLVNKKIKREKLNIENQISFIIFGSIHPLAPVEAFAKEAAEYANNKKLKISVVFIGRCGNELAHWVSVLEKEGLGVELLGEQAPERISEALGNASIGISTSSIAYIDKSGSVVAMREHGLAVICVSKPSQLLEMKDIPPPDGIIEYKIGNFEDCLKVKYNYPMVDPIIEVTSKMTAAFESFEKIKQK